MVSQPLTDREFQRTGRAANSLVFAGELQATVVLTASQQNLALPAVTVTLTEGVTVVRVVAAFAWRKQVDSSSAPNGVNGANQRVRVRETVSGTFVNAINIPDDSLATGATTTEGGMLIVGTADISGEVNGDGTYEVQWENAQVDGNNLTLHDLQTYLVVEFS
jgi:hypothetical protein